MTESLFLIIGLLLGASGVFYLNRTEVASLRDQNDKLLDIVYDRLGYRGTVKEKVRKAPDEGIPSPFPDPLVATDLIPPDIFDRRNEAAVDMYKQSLREGS